MKIPIVYLCGVVWWAIKAEPLPPEGSGEARRASGAAASPLAAVATAPGRAPPRTARVAAETRSPCTAVAACVR